MTDLNVFLVGFSEPISRMIRTKRTLFAVLLLLVTFRFELFLTPDRFGTPKPYLESVQGFLRIVVLGAAPILHSNARHLIVNLSWFVPFGVLLEQRTTPYEYFGFLVLVGVASNFLVPSVLNLIGVGVALAIGASSITIALASREALYRAGASISKAYLLPDDWLLLLFTLSAAIFQGYILITGRTSAGDSFIAHTIGFIIGVVWGIAELRH